MSYKATIAFYLQSRLDTGLTQAQLAHRLGFKSGNIISMHLDPDNAISPFPVARLPALAAECALDSCACLALLNQRATHHPDNATRIDKATLHFLVRCSAGAVSMYRARNPGAAHGC